MNKKPNKLDKYLYALAVFVLCFVISTMIIYTVKGWQYDTLITCVLGSGGLEAFIMGGIKVANIFKENKEKKIVRAGDITGFDDAEVVDIEDTDKNDTESEVAG